MSGETLKINRKEEGQKGIYQVPEEIYNANWRDDIAEEADIEKEQLGDYMTYENEEKFDSTKLEQSAEAERRIGAFRRAARIRGHKVYRLAQFSRM